MSVPNTFAADPHQQLEVFAKGQGHESIALAQQLVGRAGRVAYIIPEARPFAASLWSALAAALAADNLKGKRREAPPGRCAVRRFKSGAVWFRRLLSQNEEAPFVLESRVQADGIPRTTVTSWAIATDASPWGASCSREPSQYSNALGPGRCRTPSR